MIGFDIERHAYGDQAYPAQLVIQDVLTIHGSQFRNADLIVASPPCQEYSYMAMPWTRAKQIAAALRGQGPFPEGYKGSRTIEELNALFNACFRIQREASVAAGRHIPMVIENVRGAIPWVGRSRTHFGSFHLWADVPALMPIVRKAEKVPGFRFDGSGKSFQAAATKNTGGSWFAVANNTTSGHSKNPVLEAVKAAQVDGYDRDHPQAFGWKNPKTGPGSNARKAASAQIAKIPLTLSRHIAAYYRPAEQERIA